MYLRLHTIIKIGSEDPTADYLSHCTPSAGDYYYLDEKRLQVDYTIPNICCCLFYPNRLCYYD